MCFLRLRLISYRGYVLLGTSNIWQKHVKNNVFYIKSDHVPSPAEIETCTIQQYITIHCFLQCFMSDLGGYVLLGTASCGYVLLATHGYGLLGRLRLLGTLEYRVDA